MKKNGFYLLLFVLVFTSIFTGTSLAAGSKAPGTSIEASVTAEGVWEKKTSYDWTIQKSANVKRPVIKPGESYPITYTLNATRSAPFVTEQAGVRGLVTVTNDNCDDFAADGSCAGVDKTTQGLKIVIEVEYKQGKSWNKLTELEIVPEEQLAPGETKSYPYELFFIPVSNVNQYRINSLIIITNHSGSLYTEWSSSPNASFSLPDSSVTVTEDKTATLNDVYTCQAGFSCAVDETGPWMLSADSVIDYIMTVTNESAPMKRFYSLLNTATLTEDTTKQTRTADEKVNIFTGCPCDYQP